MGVASRRCARCRVAEAQWDGLDCVVVNLLLMHGCGGSVVNRGRLTVWESHDLAQIQQILIGCEECQIEDLCRCRQEPICWVSVGKAQCQACLDYLGCQRCLSQLLSSPLHPGEGILNLNSALLHPHQCLPHTH